MRNFISKYKLVCTGIVLYIAVFIVSSFISPWQADSISFADIDDSLAFADGKIDFNIKFIFYGVYELIEMLVYATYGDFTGNTNIFFLSICALFTFLSCISFLLIRPDKQLNDMDSHEKIEKAVAGYLYDNIFAYIACLAAYYLFNPAYEKIMSIYHSKNGSLVMVLFVIFIAIPGAIQFLKVLAYVGVSYEIVKIIYNIQNHFEDKKVIATVLSFIVALALIVLLNLIMDRIMEKVYKLTIQSSIAGGIILGQILITVIKVVLILSAITAVMFAIFAVVLKTQG